jgi:DNA polymerase-3 subunit alpha
MIKQEIVNYLDLADVNYDKKWLDILFGMIEELNMELEEFQKIDINDTQTYEDTINKDTSDIYILDNKMSELIKELIDHLKPHSFEELKNLLTLFRPSPLEVGIVDECLTNKENNKSQLYSISEFRPLLENILKNSYGVILYHEQISSIVQKVCNVSFEKAEEFKKKFLTNLSREEIDKCKTDFITLATSNGYSKDVSEKLFEWVHFYAPASYSEKSVISHAKIVFYLAYCKTHYPKIFKRFKS